MGRMDNNRFTYPTTRSECLEALRDFCENRLEFFGTYQDAMTMNHPLLYHANLSFAMNLKMISPARGHRCRHRPVAEKSG